VIITDGQITAVGARGKVRVPKGAKVVDAKGRYLVPGLIDGFGAMRSPAFARAYLYEGVTTVYVPQIVPNSGGDGEEKPPVATPDGPRVYLGAPVTGYSETGDDPTNKPMREHRLHDVKLTNAQLVARVDRLAAQGYRGVTLSYDVWPDQAATVVREAKRRHMAVIGELGFMTYPQGITAGVEAFVHNDRYETALASAEHYDSYRDGPQTMEGARPSFRDVCATDPASPKVAAFGALLAKSHTALMPVSTVEATADGLDIPNPWSAPAAANIDPKDLDTPVDRATGASGYLKEKSEADRKRIVACAWLRERIDHAFHDHGARYLAATAAPSYGVMPGSGLHQEIALLKRDGLTPRELISAATGAYAEAFGWTEVGLIAKGRRGDVLILDADPRKDPTAVDHIDTIVFDGHVVDRVALLKG
jgi:Amidohydrolase family